jgi:hypothetical protein
MAGTAVAIFFIVLAGRELFSRIGRTAQPAHA